MRITCRIEEFTTENDDGFEVDAVSAVCSRCGHETESFGNSDSSIARCLVLLREECPNEERNFYVASQD